MQLGLIGADPKRGDYIRMNAAFCVAGLFVLVL